jgi:hypothetical protein
MLINYWSKLWLDLLFPELQDSDKTKGMKININTIVNTISNGRGIVKEHDIIAKMVTFQRICCDIEDGNVFISDQNDFPVLLIPESEILGTYELVKCNNSKIRIYNYLSIKK